MNILVVAATKFEIDIFFERFYISDILKDIAFSCKSGKTQFDVLFTGIGIFQTIYNLTKFLEKNKYDIIINIGIAGSFSRELSIGDTVEIRQEAFANIVNTDNHVQTLFEYGLMNDDDIFSKGVLHNNNNYINNLKKVKGVTVSSISHNKEFNKAISIKFNADIETMEGAAFFYVCLKEKVAFMQIRSISNYVGEKDKTKWDFILAKQNLENSLIRLLQNL